VAIEPLAARLPAFWTKSLYQDSGFVAVQAFRHGAAVLVFRHGAAVLAMRAIVTTEINASSIPAFSTKWHATRSTQVLAINSVEGGET